MLLSAFKVVLVLVILLDHFLMFSCPLSYCYMFKWMSSTVITLLGKRELLALPFLCSLDVIGRLCSVFVPIPGHRLYSILIPGIQGVSMPPFSVDDVHFLLTITNLSPLYMKLK